MKDVKIQVNEFGTLFAVMPDGTIRAVLVDVPGERYYGIIRVGNVSTEADQS